LYLFVTQRITHPMVSTLSRLVLPLAVWLALTAVPVYAQDPVHRPAQPQTNAPENQPSAPQEQDWVEQKINPSTEWVEQLFYPFIRWVERSVQGQPEGAQSTQTDATQWPILGEPLPPDGLPAKTAARLLLSVHPGRILQLHYDKQTTYQWKHLSPEGRITVFYMDARSGVLLDKKPLESAL